MGTRNDGQYGLKENVKPKAPEIQVAEINAEANVYMAKIASKTELNVAEKNIEAQVINARAQKESAAINANTQVKVAQIKNDPFTLDANEATAYELIKKTGIVTDLSVFEVKLASGDQEALKDALNLENALKKDGKDLTADGKITPKTIAAAQGLIGENSEAILKYEEVKNKLGSKYPAASGLKVQSEEIER